MKIFNYDEDGRFTFESVADPDPLQPGEWLLPARSTPKKPAETRTGEYVVFDQQINDWLLKKIPKPDVTQEKQKKWDAIKSKRDAIKTGGERVGEFWFHTDDSSRIQYGILDGKATRSALPGNAILHPEWKTMSGVKTPMTVALLRQILDAGIASEAAIFDVAETHKVAMEASADPAAYNFSTGWPATFGG